MCHLDRRRMIETRWWDEEVQESIQRKRSTRKKWNSEKLRVDSTTKAMQCKAKKEVAKAKQRVCCVLYEMLDTKQEKSTCIVW